MKKNRILGLLMIGALLLTAGCAQLHPDQTAGDLSLPRVFGDHMVLQRDIDVPVWGWATPGSRVTIEMNGHTSSTLTTPSGEWRIGFSPMEAGGPYEMVVRGPKTIQFQNVMVGEVWLCSGQSNMEWPLNRAETGHEEIAKADYPNLRILEVKNHPAGWPVGDVAGAWLPWQNCSESTSHTLAESSAVAYFFGRRIHEETGVPVGLIQSDWGGTAIEPWTPPIGFASDWRLVGISRKIDDANKEYRFLTIQALDKIIGNAEAWATETRADLASNRALALGAELPSHPLSSRREPTGLYNGMIHPLVPFAIRGAIWYQGESNRGENFEKGLYRQKMQALIKGWRSAWNQGDFPFYFVQLAPFSYTKKIWNPLSGNAEFALPLIWESQFDSLKIPNTGKAWGLLE